MLFKALRNFVDKALDVVSRGKIFIYIYIYN